MLKGREIKGLAVFAGKNLEEIGRVQDMLVNNANGKVVALVIQSGGVINKSLYVDMQNVRQINKTGVFVPNKNSFKRLPKKTQTLGQKGWVGSKLYGANGQDKGTIADVLIKSGTITGFEISGGLIGDLRKRRDFLPWQKVTSHGGSFYEEDFFKNCPKYLP